MSETTLTRSNKVTAYWESGNVAVGVFYRTHDKLLEKRSTDADVVAAGFQMPTGTEEQPITAQEKLEQFKTFLQINASTFGIQYDPVDRRADEFKFPNKYDEPLFKEWSEKMASKAIGDTLEKVQKNVIGNLIKSGNLPEGTEINFGIGDATVEIKESYNNGNIKYADAKYPVVLQIGDKSLDVTCVVSAVSGQMKKPTALEECVLTQTGIKELLIEKGLLPKVEKPAKTEKSDADNAGENTEAPADAAPAQNGGKRQRGSKANAEMPSADNAPV